jgi:hypothetical protein
MNNKHLNEDIKQTNKYSLEDQLLLDTAKDILLKSKIYVKGNENFILRLMKHNMK